jgi:exopolyphosphatase / guanosine-5'-triphosphate,3'-diphosphate pyrophosphatase
MRGVFMIRIGAVDLGTNSVRLLIADISDSGIHPITKKSVTTRLGHRVYENGSIVRESIDKTVETIMGYKKVMEDYGVDKSFGFATSAVRSAVNGGSVIEYIESATGIKVDILSGEEEAFLGYIGVATHIDFGKPLLVVDLGGGSTEIVFGDNGEMLLRESLDIGCVRLTERFIGEDLRKVATEEVIESLRKCVANSISPVVKDIQGRGLNFEVIAIGGTAVTLAALKHGVHGIESSNLTREDLESFRKRISVREEKLVKEITNIEKGRDDIILSGIVELEVIMDALGKDNIVVSARDSLEGAISYKMNSLH